MNPDPKESSNSNPAPELNTILELYKLHSTHSHSLTQTRNAVGLGFLALHMIILRFGGSIFLYVIAIAISIAWLFYINSYKKLNKAKIDILIAWEEEYLNVDFYNREWNAANNDGYIPLTFLDKSVAISLIIVYILLIIYKICYP